MRALWEQGFFGKGHLSRSEPNWLKRELVRRGDQKDFVSEILTAQRREDRAQAKWERARLEQEAIRQTREEEAQRAENRRRAAETKKTPRTVAAPTGPLELLALPNSALDAMAFRAVEYRRDGEHAASNGPSLIEQLTGFSATQSEIVDSVEPVDTAGTESEHSHPTESDGEAAKTLDTPPSESSTPSENDGKTVKRRKSVRFSPTVESTTFNFADPPSPSVSQRGRNGSASGEATPTGSTLQGVGVDTVVINDIVNKEHLQLTQEEAFFLSFSVGALKVSDPYSGLELSTTSMLRLFRQHSYYPARTGPDDDLMPDDGFLVNYAVYHHFRSLGWVPRPGIKFAVDWLLYTRGPVFDHAEFGLIVIPSYTDAWWKQNGAPRQHRDWQWLHSVVRVLSHATKSLVLIYVDIPPPPKFDAAMEHGLTEVFGLYKVREVLVKRWSSNRNR